jgi:uncharacterized membrane protein YccF (DUF307 family)
VRFIANVVWLLCGGLVAGVLWIVFGLLWCVTVIGFPVGLQCFKFAEITLLPFSKDVDYSRGGAVNFILNILWFAFTGLEMALVNAAIGLILCCTVIGIPWGRQFFKLARLSLTPFGADVYIRS